MFTNKLLTTDNRNLSDYEQKVKNNILSMREQFNDLVESTSKNIAALSTGNKGKRKRSFNQSNAKPSVDPDPELPSSETVRYIRRSARHLKGQKKESVSYKETSDDEDSNTKKSKQGSLLVKFPWFKSNNNNVQDKLSYNNLSDDDFIDNSEAKIYQQYDKNGRPKSKRTRTNTAVFTPRLAVSEVTDEMIENIAYSLSGKIYDANGTTCHQCRQKTMDQKSYCRHKECRGIRGMFCGFCLGKRYGEDVAEVLKNPKWVCPPCRGFCNCSICRRKNGREPTGQMAQLAEASGFKSVRHMLSNTEGENSDDNINVEETDNENNEEKNDQIDDVVDGLPKSVKKERSINSETENEDNEIKNEQDGKIVISNNKNDLNAIEIQHNEVDVANNIIQKKHTIKDNTRNELADNISETVVNNSQILGMSSSNIIDVIFKELYQS